MTRFQLPPTLRALLFPALAAALAYAAWRSYGWQGLLLAASMLSFWVLLHFTRLMRLLRIAASRPMGHVNDARALFGHLKPGLPMTDVVRLALSLGQRRSEVGMDPEVLAWGDEQGHEVVCSFNQGRLQAFALQPAQPIPDPGEAAPDTSSPRT